MTAIMGGPFDLVSLMIQKIQPFLKNEVHLSSGVPEADYLVI